MNKNRMLFFIPVLFLSLTNHAWADNNYWRCVALDNQEKQWVIQNSYERVASTRALDACKKQSDAPLSCKTPKEGCEYFANGQSTRPMWRCMALDLLSKRWYSRFHPNRDDAAIESRTICQQHSGMPESCYINLMTCKNINERA